MQLKKESSNLSLQLHKQRIESLVTDFVSSVPIDHLYGQSAPIAKMSLALVAVYFVGIYTWGLDQVESKLPPVAPTVGLNPLLLLQSWDLNPVNLCWWPGENNV